MRYAALLLMFPAALALAQQPASKPASRDELRACLSEQDSLQERNKALERTRIELDASTRQLNADVRNHMANSPLPNASEEAFATFRAKTRAFEASKEALDAKGEQYDKDVVDFNKQLEARNKRCSTMVVTKADRDAVMKERAAAGKK